MSVFDLNKVLHDQQAAYLERSNVVQFPTAAMARKLHAEGKVIVHKPIALQKFVERTDDDFGPEAA